MVELKFDRYYRYDDLTRILESLAAEHPTLMDLSEIGTSYEGRPIWLVTITDQSTGDAKDKPAFWCDGNIHASEVSASTAVLHLIHRLLTSSDPEVVRARETRTFYLVPRLNPDGAEWALESPPRVVRSSTRPYPFDEEDPYGLERKDLDGDGRILSMRVKDPNGPWKICEQNARLLVRRGPTDSDGTYYRLLPEGVFHNFDGLTMRGRKIKEGLDFNRNFPSAWRPESEQHGAGPFPTSEPEIRAAVNAIVSRPNICGAITFHTFSGVHLRPPSRMADDELPPEDIWVFKTFGDVGHKMTGYPAISNYHEFRYHPKEVITGVFDDWCYDHLGIYAWTTEIWSPQRQAGITDYKYIDWFRDHPVEDDLKLLEWSDTALDGKGYIDWQPFNHPQLGEIEIGGWDAHYAFRNPPPKFLEAEVAPLGEWAIWQALASPKLEVHKAETESVGSATRLRIAVQNTGYLPTEVSQHAAKKKLVRGVVAEISRVGESPSPAGQSTPEWLKLGSLKSEHGQLAGYSHVTAGGFGWQLDGTSHMAVLEWLVSEPGEYQVEVHHPRAGRVRHTFRV